MSIWSRCLALILTLSLATACAGLLDGGDDGGGSGGTVKVDDVYAATLTLVGTAQLATVFCTGPDQAFDVDAEVAAEDVEKALKDGASCAKVTRTGAKLSLDFGAGCAPPNSPVKLQGKAEATLAVDKGKSIQVTLQLNDFGTSNESATGSGTFSIVKTAAGADVILAVEGTSGNSQLSGGAVVNVAYDGAGYSSVVVNTNDPTFVTVGPSKLTVDADGVTHKAGDCYPSGGSIQATFAGVKATLAFDAGTPSSGVAKFTPPLSKKTEDLQLPGLGWACQ